MLGNKAFICFARHEFDRSESQLLAKQNAQIQSHRHAPIQALLVNQSSIRTCTGLEQSVCTWEYRCAKGIIQQLMPGLRVSSPSSAIRSLTGLGLRMSAMALDHLHRNTCQQQGHVMSDSDGARKMYQSSLNHSGGSCRTSVAERFDIIESEAALD